MAGKMHWTPLSLSRGCPVMAPGYHVSSQGQHKWEIRVHGASAHRCKPRHHVAGAAPPDHSRRASHACSPRRARLVTPALAPRPLLHPTKSAQRRSSHHAPSRPAAPPSSCALCSWGRRRRRACRETTRGCGRGEGVAAGWGPVVAGGPLRRRSECHAARQEAPSWADHARSRCPPRIYVLA